MIINDVMIDCGIPFSKMKDKLYDIKYLLLTHIHSDHIKPASLKNIRKLFPKIKIIGNYEVHQTYGVDIIANAGFDIELEDYTFHPFQCHHDVLTYGFTWIYDGFSIIYATDTSSMENAPDEKYDLLFIESNHDEKKLDQAIINHKGGYNPYLGGKRHLSTKQAREFYYMHRRDRESVFVELHKSSRFY